ncbi:cupin domain-containing protein [Burkholderia multivorans]|uniref:cupin domain-containing protein n=1 Tax=Burkholderia multivorans TaxID=87883 RepID=UPI0004F5FB36|nr:cupin domain-containing protein [Burkholderia multivorans]AIO75265.1 cupin domain protein [Burkholderia multivorans]
MTIKHHFTAGGVYAREQTLRAGEEVQKHVHDYDHLSYLAHGTAMLDVEGELSVLHGPCMLEVKAGRAHRITAVTDLTWLCIHAESVADPETLMKG